ncbi:phycobiliprotein lyase [Merismopedia glauca]|uniref:Chromophore lyase CpcS/CpeS n=1 Tax=Merismopedia glauca CCAP 1448/3 TaxID=1296344 RepID=A0A2T1C2E5_9CYAN|nr:phycobiliprotein lyase [Merismopedia glauca]PSB02446.1 phycobiliprotein lyase [Merismopedia glauca CCAP 1448/3]
MRLELSQATAESLIEVFFQKSVGQWRSQRRYYTLPNGDAKEIVSDISIRFLPLGSPELVELAQMHSLDPEVNLVCGSEVIWHSTESVTGKKQSQGSTIFGALEDVLYRDRGFATPKPVTAHYYFTNPETLCLRTEYSGSVFEEELKLIGNNYRTRQTIISRAGEQQMIGQYLEKRV